MKRSSNSVYLAILLLLNLLLSGCATQGILAIGSDNTLPRITGVKYVVGKSSIGFEWPAIHDARVKGIKVYRSIPKHATDQKYIKIASIDDRYATHFVDRNIRPNQTYLYTFTTYSLLKESMPGTVLRITTREAFEAVDFLQTYLSDRGVVKILWKPHPNPEISGYIIERKISGGVWKYLASIQGRLMPEYIDKSAAIGYTYSYRVVARSNSGIRAVPSNASTVTLK